MSSARERLMAAAERCFEGRGINATGINDLIAEAGVARMSLYNHFASKDDVVVAYLEHRDADWRQRVEARLATVEDPRERVIAVLREYRGRVARVGFRGCLFVNAAAELPEDHPGWEVIHRHKDSVRTLLRSLADEAGLADPGRLADELFMLAEGAIVTAGIQRNDDAFTTAEHAATQLIQAAS